MLATTYVRMTFLVVLIGAFIVLSAPSWAQTGFRVSGRVTDEKGAGLAGVSISLKGTSRGTVTDSAGHYSLLVPDKDRTLSFSMLNFKPREVKAGDAMGVNIQLIADTKGSDLGEAVVIGYGTRQKVNLTGAVSVIGGDELAKSPVANVQNALAGSMPGLIVNTRSGEPGADDPELYIRGVGTFGSTAPLIVIDGIPDRQGGFGRLDPTDIASFSVLKDATGAIYGARAANGVILITTKRGVSGKPTLTVSANTSATQPTRVPRLLNSYQYGEASNEYDSLVGQPLTFTAAQLQKFQDGSDPLSYPNTNWWKTVMAPWSIQTNDIVTLRGRLGPDAVLCVRPEPVSKQHVPGRLGLLYKQERQSQPGYGCHQ